MTVLVRGGGGGLHIAPRVCSVGRGQRRVVGSGWVLGTELGSVTKKNMKHGESYPPVVR